jgi:coproporphyrinogen III oxidase-like Fe-S oxidoreductase
MIAIFFPCGAFGSTLEYCIRRFSKEFETNLADFQAKKWVRIEENQLILSEEGKHWADFIAQELFA